MASRRCPGGSEWQCSRIAKARAACVQHRMVAGGHEPIWKGAQRHRQDVPEISIAAARAAFSLVLMWSR